MWEVGTNFSESHPMIEALEGREFFSATVHAAATPTVNVKHAVVAPAKPAAKPKAQPIVKAKAAPVVKAKAQPALKPVVKPAAKTPAINGAIIGPMPAFIPATNTYVAPNIVGGWTGTMLLDGATTTTVLTMNLKFQHGIAASGDFDLGPAVGNQTVTSTMVFGTNRTVRVLILNGSLWMGFTGVLAANGNVIIGRYGINTANGWETGTFQLNWN